MAKRTNKKGAGRPKGTQNKTTKIARDLLLENRERLIQRALDLALDAEKPNERLLAKLLDKLIPTLQSIDQTTTDNTANELLSLSKTDRDKRIKELLNKRDPK